MRRGAEPGGSAQEPWMHGTSRTAEAVAPLPYYLQHFREVLHSVQARYGFLLSAAEHNYIARVDRITLPAQMLYARLVNRRGPFFRADKVSYTELPDAESAIAELKQNGLLDPLPPSCLAADAEPILRCFTLPELLAELRQHKTAVPSRRSDLLPWLLSREQLPTWLSALLSRYPVIRLAADDPWAFLRFLFFGELRDNLSDFVVRELGFVVGERIPANEIAVKFETRQQATDAFRMACLYEDFRRLRDILPPRETLAWWIDKAVDRSGLRGGVEIFDRLVDRLGRRLERAKEHATALALYETSPQAPSRERRTRLLIRDGRLAEATILAQEMAAGPHSVEEAYAARHLLRRLQKSGPAISDARRLQKLGRSIHVTDQLSPVEIAVLAHYKRDGWDGVHAENWLWLAAFGLLFWDIIHDTAQGVFHSPLQIGPSDLYTRNFYARRHADIEARLAEINDQSQSSMITERVFRSKHGFANPFVPWQENVLTYVQTLISRLPGQSLAAVLGRLSQDIRHHARGFPDLFLWSGTNYSFVEVKSESDQLSPQQYEWLTFFEGCGIPVFVDNVRRPKHPAIALPASGLSLQRPPDG
jgi:hypothetical protein